MLQKKKKKPAKPTNQQKTKKEKQLQNTLTLKFTLIFKRVFGKLFFFFYKETNIDVYCFLGARDGDGVNPQKISGFLDLISF